MFGPLVRWRRKRCALPDRVDGDGPGDRRVSTFPDLRLADALDRTLDAITESYGEPTTNVVAMQLEYPR